MEKLNLDDDNVFVCYATPEEIRQYLNGEALSESIEIALDEAQGKVFSQERKNSFVVIEIS